MYHNGWKFCLIEKAYLKVSSEVKEGKGYRTDTSFTALHVSVENKINLQSGYFQDLDKDQTSRISEARKSV